MSEKSSYGPHNYTTIKARVIYGDTDKMGIVYHANYFRWFEALRAAYMRTRGRPYSVTEKSGIQLPLTECGIKYHKPARYEDIIEIRGWVENIGPVQIRFEYEIFLDGELLVSGFSKHAAINEAGRPTKFPDDLFNVLSSVESVDSEIF